MKSFTLSVSGMKPLIGQIDVPSQYPLYPNEAGWRRYYVLHDWQRAGDEFPHRNSVDIMDPPEVNRIGVFNDRNSHLKVPLTAEMQFYWAELLSLHKYARKYSEISQVEKRDVGNALTTLMGSATALTNRTSLEAANYVTGEWLEYEPARMAALICGGSTVWGKPSGVNTRGTEMVEILSWSRNEAFPVAPTMEFLLDPRTLWLTAIYEVGKVFPFSTLGVGVGVPYPLITHEPYYYPRKGLLEYSFDAPFISQYVPPRQQYP